ncbi:histidinol-phosphate transaminase [Desulfallas thermosapovorans]|uniref:Histidinol-phosphate aminotransferase n=1 Tax=Desulfallas thermosapovorans DSM 6562 TaxID=1121431 RepID=A0A5S4ZU15_9FIRM|nr:histidinol-phosphate transaminase [Desulfallas thermosapovorans]TYO96267.1 histidinol-phosphate aminotransferase [Desulfallas thermosapovorans DSM 6562]
MDNQFDPGLLVRERLKELIPYQEVSYPEVIKLNANENPYDFPAEIWRDINEMLGAQSFTRYPDAMAQQLIRELARCYSVGEDNIMVGNGSDELILNLMLTFGAGNRVVIAVPTFSMYGIHARVAGAEIVEVARLEDFGLDVPGIIRAGESAALVVICSPNNPTGNSATVEQVQAILAGCQCPVVVDQAYVEFGGQDFLPLLDSHPNLVILRTFSKAYGLAGLRVGYLFARPRVLQYLFKVKQPFNLNIFSQTAALAVLRCRDIFARQVAEIVRQREALYKAMRQMPGFDVLPSDANYLMFKTCYPAVKIFEGLLERGVLVRNFGDPLLTRYLRVSVGQPEENMIFLHSLQQVIAELGEKD